MFSIFYLIIVTTLLYAHQATGTEFSVITATNREQCEMCKRVFNRSNASLNDIQVYNGFDEFQRKYKEIQHFGIEDSELICLLTDMCQFDEETETDLIYPVEIEYNNDLEQQAVLSETQLKFKLTNPVCSACKKVFKYVVKQVEHLAAKRRHKGVVRGFFAKGCRILPHFIRNSCTVLIKKKSGKLAKMVLEHYAPRLACKAAHACF